MSDDELAIARRALERERKARRAAEDSAAEPAALWLNS